MKRVLGEGAFSVVQLVTDTATGVDYALKVIDCGEDSDVAHAEKASLPPSLLPTSACVLASPAAAASAARP